MTANGEPTPDAPQATFKRTFGEFKPQHGKNAMKSWDENQARRVLRSLSVGESSFVGSASKVEKQRKWDEVGRSLDGVTDELGEPIDVGIKETVVAFNVLGFQTTRSCEGHLDESTGYPWISITNPDTKSMEKGVDKAFADADQVRINNGYEASLSLYEHAHRLREEAREPLNEDAKKLIRYLDKFYMGRSVPYDARLSISQVGMNIRVESQGSFLQDTASPQERADKLGLYQAEMRDFTEFLKAEHFNS